MTAVSLKFIYQTSRNVYMYRKLVELIHEIDHTNSELTGHKAYSPLEL